MKKHANQTFNLTKIKVVSFYFVGLILLSHCYFSNAQDSLPQTSDGWTIITPSEDSLILYVSSSDGNDETGKPYTIKDLQRDPLTLDPQTNIKPYKTFKTAFEQTRNGKPDWILIKRGDSFFESIKVRSGKNLKNPFYIATYGRSRKNPSFNTGDSGALHLCCKSFSNIVIQGLDFYSHTRDPSASSYISAKGSNGLNIYIGLNYEGTNFLLEGNRFSFYQGNSIQGPGVLKNVVLRRNSFFDNYSTESHSQGLYVANVSVQLEENIFDHNGWLVQADKENGKAQGAATIFNHNTYFANAKNVVFINNIFARSASIQNKWTANQGVHSAFDIMIKDNLYIDGEIGISAGGNKLGPHRFKDFKIVDNIMTRIGQSQPTNRNLGWGIEVKDWDGGLVKNNYFLNQVNPDVTNAYAIKITGATKNVAITNNTFSNLFNANAIVLSAPGSKKNIAINNNRFSFSKSGSSLIRVNDDLTAYSFNGNHYFHEAGPHMTFTFNASKRPFWRRIFNFHNSDNFNDWIAISKEQTNQWVKTKEQRTIESYMKSVDKKNAASTLIQELRNMSMLTWDDRYTAKAINTYMRNGYQ